MKGFFAIIAVIFSLIYVVYLYNDWMRSIHFTQHCGGHLKLAADSNTVPLAIENLEKALIYIEDNRLTGGYSSIIWDVPANDVGFWYKNIKSSLEELQSVGPEATQLEKTNILMKLRESLTDEGESGTVITLPDRITTYPYHMTYFIWGWLSFGAASLFWFFCWAAPE